MHQDQYGFMWFGTYDGLNLYNGIDVETFRYEFGNKESLLGNGIYSITNAENGYLWISTQLGLNKFSLKEKIVVEAFPEYKKTEFIVSDKIGNTWILSRKNYLLYYDVSTKVFHDVNQLHSTRMDFTKALFFDKKDELWNVTTKGTLQNLTISKTVSNSGGSEYNLKVKERVLHEKSIVYAFYRNELICFVDASFDLFLYDKQNGKKTFVKNIAKLVDKFGIISDFAFFQDDIFIAFVHNGLVKLEAANHYEPELISLANGVFCLLKDANQEALWVGTDGVGVELYYEDKEKFGNILLENLPVFVKKPVRALYTEENGTLWFGTKGDGIVRVQNYDQFSNQKLPQPKVRFFTANKGLYEDPVFCFQKSNYKNDLWIGTHGGVSYYSYKDDRIYHVEDNLGGSPIVHVHSLVEANDSTLWLATISNGVQHIVIDKTTRPYNVKSKSTHTFRIDNILCSEFYSMIYDGDSTLLIGSRGGYGVIKFNIHSKAYSFLSMNNTDHNAIGDVLCVYESRDSILYVGASSGLTTIDMSVSGKHGVKQFDHKNGMDNDMIHGILEDKQGIIWLSTNKGLVKFNPRNESFYNYGSSAINVFEFSDDAYWLCPFTGRLFFGGVNGLTWVEPQAKSETSINGSPFLFYELSMFNKKIPLYDYNENAEKVLRLEANENSFSITFMVLDYINDGNYNFSYMLEGYDSNWISLQKDNRINFTKLPYGKYTLKIKYKKATGNGDDTIHSLAINIQPPWYLSTFAIIIYIILFLLSICFSVYYVYRRMQKRQRYMARRIKEEQKEQLLESKLRFFTNVSHELFTPLTLIKGAYEQILAEENRANARMHKYATILKKNITNLDELVQEIVDFRKIEESDEFTYTIESLPVSKLLSDQLLTFEEFSSQHNINLESDLQDNIYWNTDRPAFKKIISNLLSNAFKYVNKGGTIRVSLKNEENQLVLNIYNTGKGIEKEKLPSLFDKYKVLDNMDVNDYNQMTSRNGLGLFICQSMVHLLNGTIDVQSVVGQYAEFKVELPLLPLSRQASSQEEQDNTEFSVEDDPSVVQREQEVDKENKILVLDDNEDIAELISDILSPYFEVEKAYKAVDAFEMLKGGSFTLVITDIMMPDIDGLAFVGEVRENEYAKDVPIIALSAKTSESDCASGYEAGVDAYIKKPFTKDLLLSIVNQLLQKERSKTNNNLYNKK